MLAKVSLQRLFQHGMGRGTPRPLIGTYKMDAAGKIRITSLALAILALTILV
jgi:hypothetical protein